MAPRYHRRDGGGSGTGRGIVRPKPLLNPRKKTITYRTVFADQRGSPTIRRLANRRHKVHDRTTTGPFLMLSLPFNMTLEALTSLQFTWTHSVFFWVRIFDISPHLPMVHRHDSKLTESHE
jgi:hypothetical protein